MKPDVIDQAFDLPLAAGPLGGSFRSPLGKPLAPGAPAARIRGIVGGGGRRACR